MNNGIINSLTDFQPHKFFHGALSVKAYEMLYPQSYAVFCGKIESDNESLHGLWSTYNLQERDKKIKSQYHLHTKYDLSVSFAH